MPPKATPAAAPAVAPTETTTAAPAPRLGDLVSVVLASDDAVLINNDTGVPFAPGVATQVLVTPTTLRRLQDGDLVLAGA